MELSILDTTTRAEEGVEFEVRHPKTGEGIGFYLTVKGADSQTYKNALKEAMKKASDKTTQNDIKEQVLVACTVGWRAVNAKGENEPITIDGKEIKFCESSLKEMLKRMPTIRDQGVAFQDGRANFLPIASAS
ncbi:MAG: hypothetical protein JNG85_13190 [Spirochaetaceae bacterium]|nr:hypothetical protein [Spirochaetaceae bacterium]